MTAFVGLDLAWGEKNASGVCVLKWDNGELSLLPPAVERFRIAADVGDWLDGVDTDIVAAIDAPLVVANKSGRRPCESALSKAFARQYCATHSTNLDRLKGPVGPSLCAELARRGFEIVCHLAQRRPGGRVAFEMYPHAFHVVSFELRERLLYKSKAKKKAPWRSQADFLWAQIWIYRSLLLELLVAIGVQEASLAALPPVPTTPPSGARRKDLEDMLDAVSCAAAAFLAWNCGLTPADGYGDAESGYIAVPGLHRDPRFARVPSNQPARPAQTLPAGPLRSLSPQS